MAGGIEIRKAHFPGRAPIEAYGNGGFRFADMSHRGSVLCLPSGIYGWQPRADVPDSEDLARIIQEAAAIEILCIGTGRSGKPLAPQTGHILRRHNISFEIMNTGAAVRSLNILLSEGRAAAAALYAVE